MLDLSKNLGVFSHLFICFTPQGRGKEHLGEIIPKDELKKIKNKIENAKTENRSIRMYDYSEYLHSCVLLTPEADVISQGFYEEDSIKVGNMLETPLNELFANDIFDHPTHIFHYIQRRIEK